MTNIQQYLKETIDLLVLEILGKFNFAEFKKIAMTNVRTKERSGSKPWDYSGDEHPEIQYAKRFLPELGSGSSRTAFALSGGKVLKIAKNDAGIGQNKEELDTYTRLRDNSLVTKIFDYAPDFKWLVSEIVKPIDGADFEKYVGMKPYRFWELYTSVKEGKPLDVSAEKENLKREIEYLEKSISLEADEYWKGVYKERLWAKVEKMKEYEAIPKNSFALDLAKKIDDFIKKSGLHPGDITREDHFGRTIDGEIKLLDYGFSYDVGKKYYGNRDQAPNGSTGNGESSEMDDVW